ncbi:MAG: hypothetical protein L0229_10485 [Blastocatellia bacterium]|nr:hypothetical protein [Blastocatellia bacterium]
MFKVIVIFISTILFQTAALTRQSVEESLKTEVTGTIIAYHHWLSLLPCYHICAGSLIVRVDSPKGSESSYIRIDFKYPDRHFPSKLIERKKEWRFTLERTNSEDEPIEQFVKAVDAKSGKEIGSGSPAWRLVPGAENDLLPFGKVIPSYFLVQDINELIKNNE